MTLSITVATPGTRSSISRENQVYRPPRLGSRRSLNLRIGIRLDDRGLLRVFPKDGELRGSPNVIFIPMNGSLPFRTE
jgi:hypothetical protein